MQESVDNKIKRTAMVPRTRQTAKKEVKAVNDRGFMNMK